MFETDKTIMGSRTNFDIDINSKEKLVYNYEMKKRLLKVFVYDKVFAMTKEDAESFELKGLKEFNEDLVIVNKSFLKTIENDIDIEIQYIKVV